MTAILASVVFGFVAVFFNYFFPDGVFLFLVNSSGAVALFVWLVICFSQLRMRKIIERETPEKLVVKMWLYPYLTWATIGLIVFVLGYMLTDTEHGNRETCCCRCWSRRSSSASRSSRRRSGPEGHHRRGVRQGALSTGGRAARHAVRGPVGVRRVRGPGSGGGSYAAGPRLAVQRAHRGVKLSSTFS